MNEQTLSPAFLYGESVFTTCLVKNGIIEDFQDHFDQLVSNVTDYYFLAKDSVEKFIKNSLEKKNFEDGVLRITISAKPRSKLIQSFKVDDLLVTYSIREVGPSKENLKLKVIKRLQDPLLDQLKVGSYGQRMYLKRLLQSQGYDDALFVGEGKVFETSTSNIFFIKNDKLITPASGIYLGITRKKIIEKEDVEVRDVLIDEISSFDGAFLTNSVSKKVSVSSIDSVVF